MEGTSITDIPIVNNNPVEQQNVKKRKKWLLSGLSIVSLLLVLLAGYFLFVNYAQKEEPSPPIPVETKKAPDNWKSYESRLYRYKFRYPSEWTIDSEQGTQVIVYNGFPGPGDGGVWAIINVTPIIENPAAEEEFNKHYQTEPGPIKTIPGNTAFKYSNVEIDGNKGIYYSEVQPRQGESMLTSYYVVYQFIKNNYLYKVSFSTGTKQLEAANTQTYDTIIGSFQFM